MAVLSRNLVVEIYLDTDELVSAIVKAKQAFNELYVYLEDSEANRKFLDHLDAAHERAEAIKRSISRQLTMDYDFNKSVEID